MAQVLRRHYTGSSWSARRLVVSTTDRVLWLLALVAAAGWSLFAWWYSLPANETNTHFAFEKVPGGFASPMLRGTLVLFLLLVAIYAAGFLLISRQERLSPGARFAIVAMIGLPAIANLFVYPVGALDVFNYMIELKLAYGYGENPYLVTFAGYRDDPFALPAFLVDVPLFYGPVWLIAYGLPVAVVGFQTIVGLLGALKLVNLFTIVLAPLLLAVMLRDRWGWRRLAFTGSLALLVVVVSVMPFWADGAMIDGLREGTAKSQEMNHVSVLSLAQQAVSTRSVSSGVAPLVSSGSSSTLASPPAWQPNPLWRLSSS